MPLSWPSKDPDELLDYQIDWSERLGDDTISSGNSSSWDGDDDDLIIEDESHTDTTTTVWLSGGVLETRYLLTNTIWTDGGRILQQSIYLPIRAK